MHAVGSDDACLLVAFNYPNESAYQKIDEPWVSPYFERTRVLLDDGLTAFPAPLMVFRIHPLPLPSAVPASIVQVDRACANSSRIQHGPHDSYYWDGSALRDKRRLAHDQL